MTPFIEVWGLRAVGFVSLAGVFLDVKAPITRDFTMRVANFLLESRDRICTRKSASFDIIAIFNRRAIAPHHFCCQRSEEAKIKPIGLKI
jgi:hypothetical protein